jgi:hypothetical protein
MFKLGLLGGIAYLVAQVGYFIARAVISGVLALFGLALLISFFFLATSKGWLIL